MGRKYVLDGAPAYFALYTSMWTILLSFFILLNAFSSFQEAGFEKGIGEIQNAFGVESGLGLFRYVNAFKGGSKAPNPSQDTTKEQRGIHEDLVKSAEGGLGNTNADFEDSKSGKYLRIRVPVDFSENSASIGKEMDEYLSKVGMGFSLFNYMVSVRCYATGGTDENSDRVLAQKRAAQIMRYLNKMSGVPYSRMDSVGYSSANYFFTGKTVKYDEIPRQGNYFYIFMKAEEEKEAKQRKE